MNKCILLHTKYTCSVLHPTGEIPELLSKFDASIPLVVSSLLEWFSLNVFLSLNKPHVRRGKTQTCEKSNLFSIDVHIMFRTSLLYAVLIVESQKTKPYSQWECIKTKVKYKNIKAMKVQYIKFKKKKRGGWRHSSIWVSWISINSSHPEMKTKLCVY